MKNSKEIVVLIIMILVVLVSTARAENKSLPMVDTSDIAGVEFLQLEADYAGVTTVNRGADNESLLEFGVVSTSSLSNLQDDYGFVVTITKMF